MEDDCVVFSLEKWEYVIAIKRDRDQRKKFLIKMKSIQNSEFYDDLGFKIRLDPNT